MAVEISYKPTEKQLRFHNSVATECFFGGAKGPGKSRALIEDAKRYALQFPGSDPHLFRETYEILRDTLIKEWKESTPVELYDWNEQAHEARMRNGSVVKFRYVGCYADAMSYDGRSIPYLGIDELPKHCESTVQQLQSCNRSAKGWPVLFRASGNPGGIGHAYVKNRYVVPTGYGKYSYRDPVTGSLIEFVPATVYDGVLTQTDPAYVKRLENLPETRRKALLHGDWDIFEGQYFSNFGQQLEEEPFDIAPHVLRESAYGSFDYGPGKLGISSFSYYYLDGDGVIHKLFNWWKTGLSASELAEELYDFLMSFPYTHKILPKIVWCDHNLFPTSNLDKRTDSSPVTYFQQRFSRDQNRTGTTQWEPAIKNRVHGAETVLDYFQPAPVTGKIRFKYWPKYNRTFAEKIKLLIHDEDNPGDVLKCDDDHWYDDLRYGIMGLKEMGAGTANRHTFNTQAVPVDYEIHNIMQEMLTANRIGMVGV